MLRIKPFFLALAGMLVSGSTSSAPEKAIGPTGEIELVPLTAPGTWVTADDYPTEAIRSRQEGKVFMSLQIAEDGAPRACHVDQSSGSPALDEQSCSILMQRARFQPPEDLAGRPVEVTYKRTINWVIPRGADGVSVPVTIETEEDRYKCSAEIAGQRRRLTKQLCQALVDSVLKAGRPIDGPIMAEFPDTSAFLEPIGN